MALDSTWGTQRKQKRPLVIVARKYKENMPENEPLLEELCKTFNMKKEDKREFVIRAHIIEAKGMQG